VSRRLLFPALAALVTLGNLYGCATSGYQT